MEGCRKQKKDIRRKQKERVPQKTKQSGGTSFGGCHITGESFIPRFSFGITPGPGAYILQDKVCPARNDIYCGVPIGYTFGKSPAPAAPVIQAVRHITVEREIPQTSSEVQLPNSEWPTMIFEAMGTDLMTCRAVYEESCRYQGNSICIYGLNMRRETERDARAPLTEFDKDARDLGQYAGELERGIDEDFLRAAKNERRGLSGFGQWQERRNALSEGPVHLLYTFAFTWKKPHDVGERDPYKMPFVEARGEVMKNARLVRDWFQGEGNQYHFLYRWIDGDARNDTTSSLGAGRLLEWADSGDAKVITGRYDWRHSEPDFSAEKPQYCEFVERLNNSEKRIRDYYYMLAQKRDAELQEIYSKDIKELGERILEIQHDSGYGRSQEDRNRIENEKRDFMKKYFAILRPFLNEPSKGGFLPGYYFPETALIMNEEAHEGMVYGGEPDESRQDKESMKIVSRAVTGHNDVLYASELSIQKPLKYEFTAGTYLGADLLNFLKEKDAKTDFITALKNVRQSAFQNDKWYFIKGNEWNAWETAKDPDEKDPDKDCQESLNQKRRDEMEILWTFLQYKAEGRGQNNLGKIHAELRA